MGELDSTHAKQQFAGEEPRRDIARRDERTVGRVVVRLLLRNQSHHGPDDQENTYGSLGRNRTETDWARPSSRFVRSAFVDLRGLAKNELLLVRQLQTPTFLFDLPRREWPGFHMAQISTPQK